MSSIIAKPTITNDDVIAFLDDIWSEADKTRNRWKELDIPPDDAFMEDINNLFEVSKNLCDKLKNEIELTDEEKDGLIDLMLLIKTNIERGIEDGTYEGIEKYINQLK